MKRATGLLAALVCGLLASCEQTPPSPAMLAETATSRPTRVEKTDAEWKKILSPEAYAVLRQKGTERAFTGQYAKNKDKGTYVCAGCANPLFDSETKFESGTGWPSFWQPIEKTAVKEISDTDHGMVRTEVVCAVCDGHLGHVFDDGPKPTGLRYCMNSAAMWLKKE